MNRLPTRPGTCPGRLSLLFSAFLTLAALLLPIAPALAEGSRNLYPAGTEAITGAGRGALDVSDPTQSYLNVVRRRGFIYVYAQAGERILLGSRNRTAAGVGIIQVYNPQSFGTPGAETLPGSASFTCTAGTDGLIATRAQELAGPRAVSGGGNPGGYVPCVYVAPATGIYGVNFTGASTNTGSPQNALIDPPAVLNNAVSAWDVTVRSSDTSTTDINGRMFTYAWTVFTFGNGDGRRLFQDLYYVTLDGYRYRQRLRGIDPNGGTFFANTLGFLDQGEPLYKNIRATNPLVSAGIPAGVSVQPAQFPIFFSDITPSAGNAANNTEAERVLTALSIPTAPLPPQVNNFQFTYPPTGGSTAYVGQGGTFNFTVTDTISFEIVVSRDGVNFDPALPVNRVLTGQSGTGAYSVVWDGRDNAGNNFPPGNGYRFRLVGRNGEAHFPFADVEGNLNGGPSLTKLNGNIQDALVYYDDRGYVTRGGTAVGQLNGHLCGAGSTLEQSTPNVNLVGADSNNANFGGSGRYYRFWLNSFNANADCAAASPTQGFGDAKGLNLWTYQVTSPQSSILDIIDFADVIATVQAPASADPGANVLVNIGFGNVGSQNAANVGYAIQLPPGLSGVSCAGASCAYNPVTGVVTVTGLPGSLSPGQMQNISLSYIAPASGSVPVTATISTTTNQGPNLAPDSANGITVIGGSNEADVMTRVLAPATAVAGAVVSVDIEYANVGGSTAAGLVYALQLPPGLSGVSCTAGVTCTYNPATGAVSVTGLPGSLAAGASAPPFQLRYTAPASGSVQVQSTISTTSPESNLSNNTDAGVTTVLGTQSVDIAAAVEAPATAAPGSLITAEVRFQNVGSTAFTGASYSLQLPAGLTGVSCVAPVVCTYNAGTGAVSVSGLSGNLSPGDLVSLSLRYNAPASGVVTVTATANVAGDVNPANDSASASTTVITAGTGVDVTTSLSAPATAAPGSVVNVPVSFSNLGPDPAAGLVYSLSLPPGLAGVSCSGAGISCTYNAVTGAVTVSGAPSSLASGDGFGFNLSYTAPGSGTVEVQSGISTTTPEANLSNNTAQGSTLIVAATTADVTTSVSAPASVPPSSPVQVQVGYANVGASSAANVGYNISLSAGASAVEIRFNGVLCTYNAGTGVVSGCGLPSSLVPGQQLQLDVSYTAPATPATITVTSTISTSTTQTNTGNDTASAATQVLGSPELTLTKTASSASFVVGVPASYTLQLQNTGVVATTAAASITDTIPSGLTLGTLPAGCTAAGQTVTCTIAAGLAAGANTSFVIPVTPTLAAVPSVSNTATVNGGGDPTCPAATRCSSTVVTPVNAPELTITKTASAASFTVGTPATYTLQVSNTGTAATTATITITDTIPSGLTLGTLPAGCTAAGQTVTCTVASLAVGASTSFVIPVTPTVTAVPSVSNTATVSGGGDPTCPVAARCDSTVVTPVNAPELTITKTASGASFVVGTPASYTLSVQNTGSAATTAAATVTDVVPASLTLGTMPANCSAAAQTVTCTIAAGLAVNATVDFVIPVTPTAAATPSVQNTASVGGGGDPGCPGLPRCTSTIDTPVNSPALTITKTASAASFVVGTPASYTLSVQNTGSAATTAAATVTDVVPASLTLGTMPANCSAAAQTVTCTIAAGLAVNATVDFVIPVTPTAAATPSVQNTASVGGGGDPGCPGLPRCTSTIDTPVNSPALTITKTASAASFTVGTPASYTLSVQNTGSAGTTAAATVTDVVPASLTLGTLPANCSATGQTVTCTIASGLAVNATVTFVIPVTPTAAATPSVQNTASVGGGGDPGCPGLPRCTSTIDTPVLGPNVTLAKSANPASGSLVVVGATITYTLQATVSDAPLTAAFQLTDTLGAGLLRGAVTAGPFTCSAGEPLVCSLPSGTATGTYSLSYTATVQAGATGSVNNSVTISGNGGDPDPVCSPCTTTHPLAIADLQVIKTVDQMTPSFGQVINFSVQVRNNGPDAATNVVVTDALPLGFELLGTTPSQGSYTAPLWTVGNLAVGQVETLVMQVRVRATGNYRNVATVRGDQFDPIDNNNEDSVGPTPPSNPRPAVIPADAPWALLSLMLLMMGMAGLQLRRRG